MGVEIVLHQSNLSGVRKMDVRQVFEDFGVINGGAAVCDLNVPKALQRREQHEQIGGTVSPVLVIGPLRASRFHRERRAGFGNQLLGGLIQADQRHLRIVRLGINVQHRLWPLRRRHWPPPG